MNFATKMKQHYDTLEESQSVPASEITDIEFVKHTTYGPVLYKFIFADGTERFFEVQTGTGLDIESMEEVEFVELG